MLEFSILNSLDSTPIIFRLIRASLYSADDNSFGNLAKNEDIHIPTRSKNGFSRRFQLDLLLKNEIVNLFLVLLS